MRWTKVFLLALVAGLFAVPGDGPGSGPGRRAGRGHRGRPEQLDIHAPGANRPSYQSSWNLYDRLLTFGAKTLPDGCRMYDYAALKPELAESWQVAPDGMSVTFKLRHDAKFHDGTPVTANDVKWSFDRAVTVGGFPTFQMKAGSLEKPEQFVAVDDVHVPGQLPAEGQAELPDLAVPVPVVINSELAKKHATRPGPVGDRVAEEQRRGRRRLQARVAGSRGRRAVYARFDDWKSGPAAQDPRRVIVREVPVGGQPARAARARRRRHVLRPAAQGLLEIAKEGKLKVVGHPRSRTRMPLSSA